jgi:hypothetical protein
LQGTDYHYENEKKTDKLNLDCGGWKPVFVPGMLLSLKAWTTTSPRLTKFPTAEQNGCWRSLDPGTGTGHGIAGGSVGRGMVVPPGGVWSDGVVDRASTASSRLTGGAWYVTA